MLLPPQTNVSSCTYYDINIDSTQCPEGSSVVAGKTARDQCTEEPGQCANLIVSTKDPTPMTYASHAHRKHHDLTSMVYVSTTYTVSTR